MPRRARAAGSDPTTSEVRARMPPSPWLSARSTNTTYLTETTRMSDQRISEHTPITFARSTGISWPSNVSRKA